MLASVESKLIALGVALAAVLVGWTLWTHRGQELAQARREAAQWQTAAQDYKAATGYEQRAYALASGTGARYAQASGRVEIQTRTLLKEVPVYVTPETDARCFVPVGLVRVYDAAATGADPAALTDPAGRADGAASGIACSELAADLADNFGLARQNAEQLSALQDFAAGLAALSPSPAKDP